MNIAQYIDHTLLKATATPAAIEKLCTEAREYRFATVCVNPCYIPLCAKLLAGSGVGITTVVGFPLGASDPAVKAYEAQAAIAAGASEIDMVLNIGHLLAGDLAYVEQDIARTVAAVAGEGIVKVILETAYLSREQIVAGCKAAVAAGAHFVKTSTGFAPTGARYEDVRLMRETVGAGVGVKAAGGIANREIAEKMLAAGANRLGASAGVAIVQGSGADAGY